VCQAFSCTPAEALRQNPKTVFAVMEARMAKIIKEQHDTDVQKLDKGQVAFWRELNQALEQ